MGERGIGDCLAQKPPMRMALGSIRRASLSLRARWIFGHWRDPGKLRKLSHLLFMAEDRISET